MQANKKEQGLSLPVASLVMTLLVSSVSASLELLSVEPDKKTEIAAALTKCAPQEVPAAMTVLSSYYQARAMEIGLTEWDRQRKEDEQRRLSGGLSIINKLLN